MRAKRCSFVISELDSNEKVNNKCSRFYLIKFRCFYCTKVVRPIKATSRRNPELFLRFWNHFRKHCETISGNLYCFRNDAGIFFGNILEPFSASIPKPFPDNTGTIFLRISGRIARLSGRIPKSFPEDMRNYFCINIIKSFVGEFRKFSETVSGRVPKPFLKHFRDNFLENSKENSGTIFWRFPFRKHSETIFGRIPK